jgi:hypothetical protein
MPEKLTWQKPRNFERQAARENCHQWTFGTLNLLWEVIMAMNYLLTMRVLARLEEQG